MGPHCSYGTPLSSWDPIVLMGPHYSLGTTLSVQSLGRYLYLSLSEGMPPRLNFLLILLLFLSREGSEALEFVEPKVF